MNTKLIFIGMILITLPGLYFLDVMGLLDFDWRYFLIFWPLLLIFWGIWMLPFKEYFRIVFLALLLMGTGFFVYYQAIKDKEYFKRTTEEVLSTPLLKKWMENMPTKDAIEDPSEIQNEEATDSTVQNSQDSTQNQNEGGEPF
jgi:hypothetical protein